MVVEEPLSIFIQGEPWTVTLRSPGQDEALAVGLLYSEGLIASADDILSIETDDGIHVTFKEPPDLKKHRYALERNSACGLCGAQSIDQLARRWLPIKHRTHATEAELMAAPEHLRRRQKIFSNSPVASTVLACVGWGSHRPWRSQRMWADTMLWTSCWA